MYYESLRCIYPSPPVTQEFLLVQVAASCRLIKPANLLVARYRTFESAALLVLSLLHRFFKHLMELFILDSRKDGFDAFDQVFFLFESFEGHENRSPR
jgi:hypothetical protein